MNLIFIVTLFNMIPTHGMENVDTSAQSLQAEEHNQTYPTLTALPQEILCDIFSYYQVNRQKMGESLQDSIKNFMRLRGVCKKLYQALTGEKIGDYCKNYAQQQKNNALCTLVDTIECDCYNNKSSHGYATRRLPALILVCAGADSNSKSDKHGSKYLLEHVVQHTDEYMLKTLFKHNVDPHKNGREYGFYSPILVCKTRRMAEIFIDNNVELNDSMYPNVVWRMLGDDYSSDVFSCCAEKVDLTQIYNHKEYPYYSTYYSCPPIKNINLLHEITSCNGKATQTNSTQLLEKTKFLLEAMPKDMVNALCLNRTPIDIAQQNSIKEQKKNGPLVAVYEKLICLYREYGGLTAEELQQQVL